MAKNKTHPIGVGTDNVTVNMKHELHLELGREAFVRGYASKGAFIRAAIRELLKKGGTFVLAFGLWFGAAWVAGAGVFDQLNEARARRRGRDAVRVVVARRRGEWS